MSMQSEGKDAKGRNYDQVTKGGSSSAGSMGTGGTGDVAATPGQEGGGRASEQRASRTDDLLSGDSADQEADQGFGGGSRSGEVQTGMEGIGKGAGNAGASRQSGQAGQPNRQGAPEQQGRDEQGTPGRES